jgi:hypothetical protein
VSRTVHKLVDPVDVKVYVLGSFVAVVAYCSHQFKIACPVIEDMDKRGDRNWGFADDLDSGRSNR